MTTSGTSSFSYNRDQIIRAAYRKIGVIQAGEIPSAQMTLDGSDALNAMVKEWEAIGLHVWTETQGVLFLQPGQVQYQLSATPTDSAAQAPGLNAYVQTTVVSLASTTLVVASATGIAQGYYIGLMQNNNSLFWTTVATISGANITLTAAPTLPVVAGAFVYAYQNQISVKPLRIPQGRRLYLPSGIITPMTRMSRKDYYDLPNKYTAKGIITEYYFSPQLSTGYLTVWPAPIDSTSAFAFTWYRPIMDFDTAGDTPDLPTEWISTLVFNLAIEMAPEFGVPAQVYQQVATAAAQKLDRLTGWDRESESTYFGIDFTMSG